MRRTEGPREKKLEKTQKEVEKTQGYSKRRWKQIDVGGTERRSQTTICGKTRRDAEETQKDAEETQKNRETQRRRGRRRDAERHR